MVKKQVNSNAMNSIEERKIEDVAIYLRKSRAEETEKDLEKHRITLVEICEKYGWNYEIYQEVCSAATIENREKMKELLNDIKADMYDALLVIDQDRLSRGDAKDTDLIKNTCIATETLICIRDRVLDLSNDTDETFYEINAFLAKMEYKQIIKRLRRGKATGAKQGKWTNGPAPFPYIYANEGENKGLHIDKDDYKVYRWMIESFIVDKLSTNEIAYTLNKRGIKTRNDNFWTNKVILDILKDKTHLGLIIKNKTKKKKNADGLVEVVYNPESEWLEYTGLHRAVKTQEEHERILIQIKENSPAMSRAKVPAVKKILPLTGILKCAYCGHNLVIQERNERGNTLIIKKCWYKDELLNKCPNRSAQLNPILDEINSRIVRYAENVEYEVENVTKKRKVEIESDITRKTKEIKQSEAKVDKICELLENGVYDGATYTKRRKEYDSEITNLTSDIDILKLELANLAPMLSQKRIDVLKTFEEVITEGNLDYEGMNDLYKSIIKAIRYKRNLDNNTTIEIEYK